MFLQNPQETLGQCFKAFSCAYITKLKYMENATSPTKIEAGSDARPPSYCDHLASWRRVLYRRTLRCKPSVFEMFGVMVAFYDLKHEEERQENSIIFEIIPVLVGIA